MANINPVIINGAAENGRTISNPMSAKFTLEALTTSFKNFDVAPIKTGKAILLVQNTGSSPVDLTIKAGNGYAGVNDIVRSIPATGFVAISLESSIVKSISGATKGLVQIKAGAASSLSAVIVASR